MKELTGTGIWLWQPKNCEGGDWNKIIAKCKSCGIKWITVKSGDAVRLAYWSKDQIAKVKKICHDNGILFGTWNYSKPTTWQQEVPHIKSLYDDGVDFHFLDPETEWEQASNGKSEAVKFMQALRAAIGNDKYLVYAPFAIPTYHTPYPYREFNTYCDAVAGQLYWTEFNWTLDRAIKTHDAAWNTFNAKNPDCVRPILPIGVTYGKGYPGVQGVLNQTDVETFVNHYKDRAISFYSYDACFAKTFDTLKKLNAANPTTSNPISDQAQSNPELPPATNVDPETKKSFMDTLVSFLKFLFHIK